MEGYSVTEAASVLGVPTERVWELLARGVLSGAPEGETGMRVYLQPRPAPAPVQPTGPNGNGGAQEPERELSPFRELLTEFRNLTERYGQALLALGEARGEVAALRSRVDLLEARMDLRLPMGPPQAAGWSSSPTPAAVERAVMAAAVEAPPVDHEPAAAADAAPSDDEERRSRARGPRRATESFAEALARADDPSPPELPGGPEAAAALAAQRHGAEAGSDIGLPRDVPGADAIPVADTGAVDEPAVDDATVEMPPVVVDAAPEIVGLESEPMVDDAQPTFDASDEPVALTAVDSPAPQIEAIDVEPESLEPEIATPDLEAHPAEEDVSAPPALTTEPEPPSFDEAPEAAREPYVEHEATEVLDPEPAPAAPEVEPIPWDAERYTTDIEEPDWFAAEIPDVADLTPPADESVEEPAPPDVETPAAASAVETLLKPDVGDDVEPEEPVRSTPEADEVVPASDQAVEDSGADEMEVAPTGTQPDATASPAARARSFPGAQDLEDAIAALRAAGRAADPLPEPLPAPEPEPSDAGTGDEWPPRSAFARPTTPGAATRGPASRAYRRLRRIFPG